MPLEGPDQAGLSNTTQVLSEAETLKAQAEIDEAEAYKKKKRGDQEE